MSTLALFVPPYPQEYLINNKIISRESSGLELDINAVIPILLQKELNVTVECLNKGENIDIGIRMINSLFNLEDYKLFDYGDLTEVRFMGLRQPKSGGWN